LGDNGYVYFDTLGRLSWIESTIPAMGGTDTMSGGAGDDVMIGGFSGDTLLGGAGNDALLGDAGRAVYINGLVRLVESIDPFIGNPDYLDGGAGSNVIIGGDGADLVVGSLDNDVLAGEYASVEFDVAGNVTSVIRYGVKDDLIAD
ncbi:unnamed protein product, partial [Phaeothamnion confervicola]